MLLYSKVMKAGNAIVKKCLVLLLTTLYLFTVVTYLLYLPKFSPLRITSNYIAAASKLVVKSSHGVQNAGANVLVLLHRSYKSTIDNKRETFIKLLQIGIVFVFIVSGNTLLRQSLSFMARVVKSHRPPLFVYLSYCVLRI